MLRFGAFALSAREVLSRLRRRSRLTSRIVLAALPVAAAASIVVPSVAIAAIVDVQSNRNGDAVHIRARASMNADVATAWRVLTDYERYVEFIPDLRVSHVIARVGSTVKVVQRGDATWLIKWPLDITFEIIESPPDRLQSRAVAGSLRSLNSVYSLSPTASGTQLDYDGDIDVGFPLFAQIEQAAIERNVTRQFKAFVDEIERQAVRKVTRPADGAK